MKKTFLLFICCLVYGVSHAQLQLGTTYLGGTLGGSYDKAQLPAGKSSSISFKPAGGAFLNEHWMIGFSGEYGQQWREVNSYTSHKASDYTYHHLLKNTSRQTFGIGPMARYYRQLTPQLALFGEGSISYALTVTKSDYEHYTTDSYQREVYHSAHLVNIKTHQLTAGFSPGLAFFVTPKLGIELKANVLRYTHGIGNGPDQDPVTFSYHPNTQRNLTANFTLATASIGAGYYF